MTNTQLLDFLLKDSIPYVNRMILFPIEPLELSDSKVGVHSRVPSALSPTGNVGVGVKGCGFQ